MKPHANPWGNWRALPRRWLVVSSLWLMPLLSFAEERLAPADEIRNILENQSLYIKPPYPDNWNNWGISQIKAHLQAVDKWASLGMPPAKNVNMVGIGADLYQQAGNYWLLPYEDGALNYAGIDDRVQLLRVDNQDIQGMKLKQVAALLKKPLGQTLRLGICPVNQFCDTPQDIVVSPQPYRFTPVQVKQLGQHHVINLLTFTAQTPKRLRQLLSTKKPPKNHSEPQLDPMRQPVIIDLRDNWGGDLMATIETLGIFLLPEDEIVSFKDKHQQIMPFYASDDDKIARRYPLLLLVSQRTASAGEIFAGVLAYYGVAIIIGEETFGKCVSQTQARLRNGQLLYFTNVEVLLPEKQRCHDIGIRPQRVLDHHQIYDQPLLSEILTVFIAREKTPP